MNRNQRRYGLAPKKTDHKWKTLKKYSNEYDVLPSQIRNPFKWVGPNTREIRISKPMSDRASYFTPDSQDFSQLTENNSRSEKYGVIKIKARNPPSGIYPDLSKLLEDKDNSSVEQRETLYPESTLEKNTKPNNCYDDSDKSKRTRDSKTHSSERNENPKSVSYETGMKMEEKYSYEILDNGIETIYEERNKSESDDADEIYVPGKKLQIVDSFLKKTTIEMPSQQCNSREQYQNLLLEQYGFEPTMHLMNQLKSKKVHLIPGNTRACDAMSDDSDEHYVNDVDDVDTFMTRLTDGLKDRATRGVAKTPSKPILKSRTSCTEHDVVHISEKPLVKLIAEKFSRYKNNNIEVRKLEEKIVCIEYDVYREGEVEPIQKLRIFFSVKPVCRKIDENDMVPSKIPSTIRQTFNIADDDLNKLDDREIEIIDGKIAENKPYIDGLRDVLRRKRALHERKKGALDLKSLYQMAKKESLSIIANGDGILSNGELQEVKDLILKKSVSTFQGINRRKLNSSKNKDNVSFVSGSMYSELLKSEDLN